jgi:hypothetical protein
VGELVLQLRGQVITAASARPADRSWHRPSAATP